MLPTDFRVAVPLDQWSEAIPLSEAGRAVESHRF
jgi:hypothetical protein